MALTATYVDADTFTVATDKTTDFVVDRKVRCDCGVDGYKYGVVSASNYGDPNTTVDLTAASDDLTANLTDVDWSVVKPGAAGNIPLHEHTDEDKGGVHASAHENAGGDEVSVAGLSGELADDQPPKAHDTLAAAHGDTLAAAVSRGSIIYGNSTPKWAELIVGGAAEVLTSDGTDVTWAAGGGAATKEFWVPATYAGGGSMSHVGQFPIVTGAVAGNVAGVSFHVPADFSSITEAVFIVIPRQNDANANYDIASDYGTNGQAYNAHSEADTAATYNVTTDQLFEVDISGILSALAADDYVGIEIKSAQGDGYGDGFLAIGVRFKYS